jgi:SAM-dependent methyltransferase
MRLWSLETRFGAGGVTESVVMDDWLNRAKESAKRRLGCLYPACIKLLSPVHGSPFVDTFIGRFDLRRHVVADFGSGTSQYSEHIVCVDGMNYPNVQVVCDLARTPFKDASLDGILSVAVLEHVVNPEAHVAEMLRVLKPGGSVMCFVPFIQGYHASPNDFQRYTESGLRQLFGAFEVEAISVGSGPTSALVWILQEWLAMALSFGSRKLYRLLTPLMWILSPLKYLDVLLVHHPEARVIASGLVIVARKQP